MGVPTARDFFAEPVFMLDAFRFEGVGVLTSPGKMRARAACRDADMAIFAVSLNALRGSTGGGGGVEVVAGVE